jgi:hypothetical protein
VRVAFRPGQRVSKHTVLKRQHLASQFLTKETCGF